MLQIKCSVLSLRTFCPLKAAQYFMTTRNREMTNDNLKAEVNVDTLETVNSLLKSF